MKLKKLFIAYYCIFISVICSYAATKITLFYTNDFHGNVLPQTAYWEEKKPLIGGSATIHAFLKTQKRPYLLLDAGDIFQGTPEGDYSKGKVVIELMNLFEYDALTLGNHEFDLGEEVLIELIKLAKFPILAANLFKENKKYPLVKSYIIKEIKNIRFGIFGLITSDTPKIVLKDMITGFEFKDEFETAREIIEELKQKNVDIIIALTHLGVEKDKLLADTVPGIDVIIGGHSHTGLTKQS